MSTSGERLLYCVIINQVLEDLVDRRLSVPERNEAARFCFSKERRWRDWRREVCCLAGIEPECFEAAMARIKELENVGKAA